ncbi:MAG TPA: hypothetical protein VKR06_20060 [Ktedonosporobacter sp.]|nr:hypothetical protein [Ktedonosporobacter sp.]
MFDLAKNIIGNVPLDQIPFDKLADVYKQFMTSQPKEVVDKANAEAFQQMPQDQRKGLLETILGLFSQAGVQPQAAGVQTADPNAMNGLDFAKIASFIKDNPNIMSKLMSPETLNHPVVKQALMSLFGFIAKKVMGQ